MLSEEYMHDTRDSVQSGEGDIEEVGLGPAGEGETIGMDSPDPAQNHRRGDEIVDDVEQDVPASVSGLKDEPGNYSYDAGVPGSQARGTVNRGEVGEAQLEWIKKQNHPEDS